MAMDDLQRNPWLMARERKGIERHNALVGAGQTKPNPENNPPTNPAVQPEAPTNSSPKKPQQSAIGNKRGILDRLDAFVRSWGGMAASPTTNPKGDSLVPSQSGMDWKRETTSPGNVRYTKGDSSADIYFDPGKPRPGAGQGTLSFVPSGGRTPEEQALINQRVDEIDRQTAALKQMNDARAGIGGGGSPSPPRLETFNPFDRPGDRYGDAQMREAKYNSLIEQAAAKGTRPKNAAALVQAAAALLAPGMTAGEVRAKEQASRDSLMGNLNQSNAANRQVDYLERSDVRRDKREDEKFTVEKELENAKLGQIAASTIYNQRRQTSQDEIANFMPALVNQHVDAMMDARKRGNKDQADQIMASLTGLVSLMGKRESKNDDPLKAIIQTEWLQ